MGIALAAAGRVIERRFQSICRNLSSRSAQGEDPRIPAFAFPQQPSIHQIHHVASCRLVNDPVAVAVVFNSVVLPGVPQGMAVLNA